MMKRRIAAGVSVLLSSLLLAPGCSGGSSDDDDDDDDGPLPNGTYEVSSPTANDGCGFYGTTSYYSFASEVDVVVTPASLEISGLEHDLSYEINGTLLQDSLFGGTTVFDFTDSASVDYPSSQFPTGNEYSCKAQYVIDYRGTITGDDSFALEDEYALVVTSGSDCATALSSAFQATITTLPCTSTDTATFTN